MCNLSVQSQSKLRFQIVGLIFISSLIFGCVTNNSENTKTDNSYTGIAAEIIEIKKQPTALVERDSEIFTHASENAAQTTVPSDSNVQVIQLYPVNTTYDSSKKYTRSQCSTMIKPELALLRYSIYEQAGYSQIHDYMAQQLFAEKLRLSKVHEVEGMPLTGKQNRDASLFLEYEIRQANQETHFNREELRQFKFFNAIRWNTNLISYFLIMEETQPIVFTMESIAPGIINPQFSLRISEAMWSKLYHEHVPLEELESLQTIDPTPTSLYYVWYYDYKHDHIRAVIPQPIEMGVLQKDQYGQIGMYHQDGRLYRTVEVKEGDMLFDTNYYYDKNRLVAVVVYQIRDALVKHVGIYRTDKPESE
jgi:hypothetical protein